MDDRNDLTSLWRGLRWALGARGWIWQLGPAYRAFYRRDFHPSQLGSETLLERWRQTLSLDRTSVRVAEPTVTFGEDDRLHHFTVGEVLAR
jgi:hypothetical protein